MAEKEVLTVKEVAQMLQVSHDTVNRMIREGRLPAFRTRGQWRIRREEVEKLMRGER